MIEPVINYWAVLVAAIVSFVLGGLWYSPILFENLFLKEAKKKKNGLGNPAKAMSISFVMTLLMTYVLAHFVDYLEASTFVAGMMTGFWLWLGFIVTSTIAGYLYEGRSMKLYFVYMAYQFVVLLFSGGILAVWQ